MIVRQLMMPQTLYQSVVTNQIMMSVRVNTQRLDLQDLPSKDISANKNEIAIV